MPTANIYTYPNIKLEPVMHPEAARELAAIFPVSKTLARGTLVGELAAAPGVYDAYDHTAGDGRQVLKGITVYDIVTDVNGNLTNLLGPAYGNLPNAPIYYAGYFRCEDIANPTELDDAIAAGVCRLIQGTPTTGIFALGL